MGTRLLQIVAFTNVPAAGTVPLPHDININGTPKKPDFVALDAGGFMTVVTDTTVSVTNTTAAAASVNVWLELKHTIPRELGALTNLTPQPFIASLGNNSPQINIEDEGVALPSNPFSTINFVGAGVTATDAGGGVAQVSVPGSSGGAVADGVTITGAGTVPDPFTGTGGPDRNLVIDEEWCGAQFGGGTVLGAGGWFGIGNVDGADTTSGKIGTLILPVTTPNEVSAEVTLTLYRPDQGDQLVFEARVAVSALDAAYTLALGFNTANAGGGTYLNTAGTPAGPAGAWWLLDIGGTASGSPGAGNFWAAFRGDFDAGSGNCVIASALTAVPAAALGNNDGSGSEYIDLKIVLDQVANEVRFYANGVLASTMPGVIVLPPDVGTTLQGMSASMLMWAINTGGLAVPREAFVDYTRISIINVHR